MCNKLIFVLSFSPKIPEGAGKVLPSLMGEIHRIKDDIDIVHFGSLNHIQSVLISEYGINSILEKE